MRERLNAELKDAMRAGDKLRISTIRLINSAVKSADIEARPSGKDPIPDAEIIGVLTRMVKQRRDSVAQFTDGGRPDLADKEAAEIAIIEGYLPKQMNDSEMRAAITGVVTATGAAGIKDMGKVMGALKGQFAGQMDFGRAGAVVKELLK